MIRAIRNTSVSVNRLLPEVLSRVLGYRTCERDLLAATHACQYWRSTLTSAPSLWTCLQFKSGHDLDRAHTYLERSKSTLINVSMDYDSSWGNKVLDYIGPHIARTRSLIIQGSYVFHPAYLLFCNPAPLLQHLEIHGRQGFVHLFDNFLVRRAPSLRSVSFDGVCPTFEAPLPLHDLTDFSLYLPESRDLFRMGALFRFFSGCPKLRKIRINIPNETFQDIAQGQVILLELLVELEYAQNPGGRALPHLKVPRLKQLRVSSSLEPGQVQKLANILPHDGRALLAGTTKMLYYSKEHSLKVDLSGNGVSLSFVALCTRQNHPLVDWYLDQTCIPFGQIEDLIVEGCFLINFPINLLT